MDWKIEDAIGIAVVARKVLDWGKCGITTQVVVSR